MKFLRLMLMSGLALMVAGQETHATWLSALRRARTFEHGTKVKEINLNDVEHFVKKDVKKRNVQRLIEVIMGCLDVNTVRLPTLQLPVKIAWQNMKRKATSDVDPRTPRTAFTLETLDGLIKALELNTVDVEGFEIHIDGVGNKSLNDFTASLTAFRDGLEQEDFEKSDKKGFITADFKKFLIEAK